MRQPLAPANTDSPPFRTIFATEPSGQGSSSRDGKRPWVRKNRSWKAAQIRLTRLNPSTNAMSSTSRLQDTMKDRADTRASPNQSPPISESMDDGRQHSTRSLNVPQDVKYARSGRLGLVRHRRLRPCQAGAAVGATSLALSTSHPRHRCASWCFSTAHAGLVVASARSAPHRFDCLRAVLSSFQSVSLASRSLCPVDFSAGHLSARWRITFAAFRSALSTRPHAA